MEVCALPRAFMALSWGFHGSFMGFRGAVMVLPW